ncbi:hypothetical protein DRW41_04740 [Neobacillus piezotolerans]|uniref:Intracellular proteinase inhibitor BsuPI domain-containing protein n=1 Tax=Neobacillus piezotolerans TaxID=2259171 RepID=A0A3D8GWP4_9BACI|nr:BsuPI-related putative proteinase inhibitor [Neobacillus piezotolerans]RDU38868.1 hypothetical protein DRW41_04740 [Neobacillus piezotolerans]
MLKTIFKTAAVVLLAIGVAACGSKDEGSEKKAVNTGGSVNKEVPANPEEALDASLNQESGSKDDLKYKLTLKNKSDKEVVLEHGTSQFFDYNIKDSSGNVVYTFSQDKMFTQALTEKKVNPSDSLEVEVDASEGFKGLEKGQYTLEVWPVAKGTQELKTVTTVDWPGDSKAVSKEPVTEDVTYVGLADNHTIEVTDKNGEAISLQIDETIFKQLENTEPDQELTVTYTDDGVTKTATKVVVK